jgi:hypothetical protein
MGAKTFNFRTASTIFYYDIVEPLYTETVEVRWPWAMTIESERDIRIVETAIEHHALAYERLRRLKRNNHADKRAMQLIEDTELDYGVETADVLSYPIVVHSLCDMVQHEMKKGDRS